MKTKLFSLFLLVLFSFSVTAYAEIETPKAVEVSPTPALAVEKAGPEKVTNVQELLEKMDQNIKKEEKPILSPALQGEESLLSKEAIQPELNGKQNFNLLSQAKNFEGLPWMRTLLGTFFVCSLIVVVFLFLNAKGKAGGVFQASKTQPLKLVQKMNLGLKTDVVLLDFEGTRLLLSVQASQVQLLQSFPNKLEEQIRPEVSVQERENKEFQILEELQLSKNQLHFDAKEKLSSRVREVVQKLSPLPSTLSSFRKNKENFVEEQTKKTLTATA